MNADIAFLPVRSNDIPAARKAKLVAEVLRHYLRCRRERSELFPGGLFADPAWDMLLELYLAELMHQPLSVTSACIASNASSTTALRWLTRLEKRKLLVRVPDPRDRRRIHVQLTPNARVNVAAWVEATFFSRPDR